MQKELSTTYMGVQEHKVDTSHMFMGGHYNSKQRVIILPVLRIRTVMNI